MSSRRPSRTRQPADERAVTDLVMRLRAALPQNRIPPTERVSEAKVLQETCDYIRSLQREVGDLSERLSELLRNAGDGSNAAISNEAATLIRSLLARDRGDGA